MSTSEDLIKLMCTKAPLILIETREEARAIDLLEEKSRQRHVPLYRWSATEGLTRCEEDYAPQRYLNDPNKALAHIKTSGAPGIYILLDFHPYSRDPVATRLLREIAQQAEQKHQTIVMISHDMEIPDEIKHQSFRFSLSLPSDDQLFNIIKEEALEWSSQNAGKKVSCDGDTLKLLIKHLRGLTSIEARRIAHKIIFDDGALTTDDAAKISQEKYALLSNDGVLEYEYSTNSLDEVGGLDNFKNWINKRQAIFQGTAKNIALDPPKGVLLLGVQGCGKSLAAKAIAGTWHVPLLRLDLGSIYDKYHGETERKLRDALKTAEAMSPCILWIDEIEKGLATSDHDGGTSKRALGTLLTWMAERKSNVFLMATANDISALPPELLRKGRFDEIFFVDLPDHSTRKSIFELHLTQRTLNPNDFDLDVIADTSDGFSGSEIEQAVVSGLYSAVGNSGQLTTDILLEELKSTKPLSVIMADEIAELREWASKRTVPAN